MRNAKLQIALKWSWVIAVLIALIFFVVAHQEAAIEALGDVESSSLLTSLVLLFLAKLALCENSFMAARTFALTFGRLEVYRFYCFSQLGKYLPGMIWQYVSRAVSYRLAGASYREAGGAILVETIWVLGGAMVIGTILAGSSLIKQALRLDLIGESDLLYGLSIVSVILGLIVLLFARFRNELWRFRKQMFPGMRVIILQIVIWSFLGLSLWVLLPATDATIFYMIGLFALAYAVGFLAFFAPAGFGVREAVLAFGLGAYMPLNHALVLVLVARMVYLVVELLMALGGLLLKPARLTLER